VNRKMIRRLAAAAVATLASAVPAAAQKSIQVPPLSVGQVRFFPELAMRIVEPGQLASGYFKSTDVNREFIRGIMEFPIPDVGDPITRARLRLRASGSFGTTPAPPDVHELWFAPGADFVHTEADFDRTGTLVGLFQTDANDAFEAITVDVGAIVAAHPGENVSFLVRLAIDPGQSADGGFGEPFAPSGFDGPLLEIEYGTDAELFVASLDATQVAPEPTASSARGFALLRLGADRSLAWWVATSPIAGATPQAIVRRGAWGRLGGAQATLSGGPGVWTGSRGPLPAGAAAILEANDVHVTIRTEAFPGGEIRGQLVEPEPLAARRGTVGLGAADRPGPGRSLIGFDFADNPYYHQTTRPSGISTIFVARTEGSTIGLYALWVFRGEPTRSTLAPAFAPGNQLLGTAAFCLPSNNANVPGSCPCPAPPFATGFLSRSTYSAAAASLVCVHPAPGDPLAGTIPGLSIEFPPGTWTIAGIVDDPRAGGSGPRRLSLTSSLTITAR